MNVADVTAEFRFVPEQQEQGFRGVLFVPMVRDGVSIGVIGVSRLVIGLFPESQVELSRPSLTKLSSRSRMCGCSTNWR
jgi:GAF domain-containing protein